MKTIEPSVNDQLRYGQFLKQLDNLNREQLLVISKDLARVALLLQPAALRWAAYEAATNLTSCYGTPNKID